MIKNYIKIGVRNLLKNQVHSLVNILGLSIGLASFLLIFLYVLDEISYDKHIPNHERIYRVILDGKVAGNDITIPSVPAPLASTMEDEMPYVNETVRMRGNTLGSDPISIKVGDTYFLENQVIYADSTVFNFFGINLIEGDPMTALSKPNAVLLTPDLALKYFGDEDPIGKQIILNQTDKILQVTGIVEDMPRKSHFHYDMLISLLTDEESRGTRWLGGQYITYVKLEENVALNRTTDDFKNIIAKYVAPQLQNFMGVPFEKFIAEGGQYRFYLQPLDDIHLKSSLDTEWEVNGNQSYLRILSIVGILLLVIAGINFTNLSTSLSASRAKEIGMRKVMGSFKKQLILQFITESVIISFIALCVSSLMIATFFDEFNQLANKEISIDEIVNWSNISLVIIITFIIGVASGTYPAFFLSRFKPIQALSGEISTGRGGKLLRNSLVVFQFVISATLIIGTLFINDQLQFFRNKELGFQKENIVIVKNADILESRDVAIRELNNNPNIQNASFSTSIPGKRIGRAAYQPDDFTETFVFPVMTIDENFLELYNIQLVNGRDFSTGSSNEHLKVLLNESAAKNIGWTDPVGKTFNSEMMEALPLQVVGVIDDFHFQSLHKTIQPLIIEYPRPDDKLTFLSVKINGNTEEALKAIESVWQRMAPGRVFDFEFFDKSYASLYQNDQRLGSLTQIFSVIAIFIASMGLFGLMYHNAQKSQKEVGIRKVLGSTTSGIVLLFNRRLIVLISIAVLIAIPLSYILVFKWLQGFAYRIQIGPSPFLIGIVITFLIALVSVAYVVLRASRTNPAIVLRNNN